MKIWQRNKLTWESELAERAEKSSKIWIEGVTIADDDLCVHNLRDERNDAQYNESIQHLQLGMRLLQVLFSHALGCSLEGRDQRLEVLLIHTEHLF